MGLVPGKAKEATVWTSGHSFQQSWEHHSPTKALLHPQSLNYPDRNHPEESRDVSGARGLEVVNNNLLAFGSL